MSIELKEIKPIGDQIIKHKDIVPLMTHNGAYYHYSQVCVLMDRLKKEIEKNVNLEVE